METKEAAAYLRVSWQDVERFIETGLRLPVTQTYQKLNASKVGSHWEVTDEDLDAFQQAFDAEDPGRHPPTKIMRKLRVEANHACAICRGTHPLQFHHMLQWSKIKHYDPAFMLAICGTCHDRIGSGEIDYKEQQQYKERLLLKSTDVALLDAQFQSMMATSTALPLIASVLDTFSDVLIQKLTLSDSPDFTHINLSEKNFLNKMSEESFQLILERDDVHVTKIDHFLKMAENSALKSKYIAIAADVKERLQVYSNSGLQFEYCLIKLRDSVSARMEEPTDIQLRAVQALTSFMYINCDIGRTK